jgi:hypothetical protein
MFLHLFLSSVLFIVVMTITLWLKVMSPTFFRRGNLLGLTIIFMYYYVHTRMYGLNWDQEKRGLKKKP